ncbi:COX assembly mitochondrial protein homolog [Brevipalpus obovatus]|uniref:COX assembly mitochondrial protein homolog n=1 Tax=Brevipalpus obovatus TaxID=246614 RepID=UPI003D9DD516
MSKEQSEPDDEQKTRKWTRVPRKLAKSGPHGLGDPDDLSLRVIEKDIMITQLMREKVVKAPCKDVADEYFKCVKEKGLLAVPVCFKPRDDMAACMEKYMRDKKFREECTREYLANRSEYRRTGIPPVRRNARAHAGSTA